MELKDYELIEQIGVGSYGQVFKARDKATNKNVAVKLIDKVRNYLYKIFKLFIFRI